MTPRWRLWHWQCLCASLHMQGAWRRWQSRGRCGQRCGRCTARPARRRRGWRCGCCTAWHPPPPRRGWRLGRAVQCTSCRRCFPPHLWTRHAGRRWRRCRRRRPAWWGAWRLSRCTAPGCTCCWSACCPPAWPPRFGTGLGKPPCRLCGRPARRRSGCGAPEWRRLWRRSWRTSPRWRAPPRRGVRRSGRCRRGGGWSTHCWRGRSWWRACTCACFCATQASPSASPAPRCRVCWRHTLRRQHPGPPGRSGPHCWQLPPARC
mmetsp:Transcript_18063/g.54364  ORF Transcript_18063/g.54364 Transcript_18063/m.54364 type:complete len:262 (-) Transcript_18063:452-1237(-)